MDEGRKSFRRRSKRKDESQALQEKDLTLENTNIPGGDHQSTSGDTINPAEIQVFCEASNSENDATSSTSAHNKHSNKSCCLCWCCCCSCSYLSVKNNQSKSGKENNKIPSSLSCLNGNGEQPPSIEDIRLWGESFDRLMKCSWGRKVFRDFLKCEYSEENMLFWLACEDLKKETNSDVIEEKARIIYEDYISILSPKEVSLDSRVREIINKNMVEPTPHTFDEAQLQIYTLMHRDSYPRFINSEMYRKLAQLPSPSRKSSSA